MKLLTINRLEKSFGGIKALNKAALSIEKGKITALIGPNGSGKTTLFNAVGSLIPVEKGSIRFKRKDITHTNDYKIARLGIARTFQDVRLFRNLTIKDHIGLAMATDDEVLWKNLFRPKRNNTRNIKNVLDMVGLDKPLNTFATDLSYGQRKLLDLAMAIAKPHHLLMLDEPVAGVNPRLREEIKGILLKLQAKGDTILLIEHDMNFVMEIADFVYVLDQGHVIASGTPLEVQNNPAVLNAYLGGHDAQA